MFRIVLTFFFSLFKAIERALLFLMLDLASGLSERSKFVLIFDRTSTVETCHTTSLLFRAGSLLQNVRLVYMHDCHNPGRGNVKNDHGQTLGRIFLHTLVVGLGTVCILLVDTLVLVIHISQKRCSLLTSNKSCFITVISGQRCLHLDDGRPTDKKST